MAFYPVEEQITNFVPLNQESAPQTKIKNFTPILSKVEEVSAKAVEGVAGEALSVADIVAATPEFVASFGMTMMDALNQTPKALMEGKGIDWERARATGQRVAKPFGIASQALNAGVELTRGSELDLAQAKEESKVNAAMGVLTTGIKKGSAAVEEKTTRFTPAWCNASKSFWEPVTLLLKYLPGFDIDSPTALYAAKCTTSSTPYSATTRAMRSESAMSP
jgi:hypothetical protein